MMEPKLGVIILARLSSTRLKNKVLLELSGKTVLEQVIERASYLDHKPVVVVATTVNPQDDPIVDLCKSQGVNVHRGSEEDILSRCMGAVSRYGLEYFLRVGADCPLFDVQAANAMIGAFLRSFNQGDPYDFMSNTIERTYPDGFDVELWSSEFLFELDKIVDRFPMKEKIVNRGNMVPYVMQNLNDFKTLSHTGPRDYSCFRVTLDTPEDYSFFRKLYGSIYEAGRFLSRERIISFLIDNPEVTAINNSIMPRTGFWREEEIEKISGHKGKQFVPEYALD